MDPVPPSTAASSIPARSVAGSDLSAVPGLVSLNLPNREEFAADDPSAIGSDFPFQCPGEISPISEGVHLSRLAAFFNKCRNCPSRSDIVRLAPGLRTAWEQLLARRSPDSLFRMDGVRGRVHSDWTEREAAQLAAAYLAVLADVLVVHHEQTLAPRPPHPRIVLGYDTRAESPEFAIVIARMLRQHGAELIDLGWSTRPMVEQRLWTSGASGAVYITGAGCAPAWTGVDLLGPDGIIWSRGGVLDLVEQRYHSPLPRLVREAGPHHTESIPIGVRDHWARELHGLRPLKIRIHACDPLQHELLLQIQPLISSLTIAESATSKGTSPVGELHDAVFEWGEDSRQCQVRDVLGGTVSEEALTFQLGTLLLDEHPHVDVVVSEELFQRWGRTVTRCGPGYLVFHQGGHSEEQLRRTMESLHAPLGLDGTGRYWIRRGGHVMCDALLTTAMTLQALSRTDAALLSWGVPPVED